MTAPRPVIQSPGVSMCARATALGVVFAATGLFGAAAPAAAWAQVARPAAAVPPADTGRLAGGPTLQVGDRVLLAVEHEPTLTDTFSVVAGRRIVLPGIGDISVADVPRDHIAEHLTAELGRYFRHPEVRARALIRVGVDGEVVRPGFYAMPSDVAFADALMVAGGLTHDAKLDALLVTREGRSVLAPDAVRAAVRRGATLNDVGLESGDVIKVPVARRDRLETAVRIIAMLVTIPLAIYTLSR